MGTLQILTLGCPCGSWARWRGAERRREKINAHNDWRSSCIRGEWEVDRGKLGKARPDGPRTGPFFHAKWFTHDPHEDSYGRVDGGKTSIAFWFILLVYLAIWSLLFFAWRFLRRRVGHRVRERAMTEGATD